MAQAAGQAAGLAVGAAVGSLVGQPAAGAALGGSAVGFLQERGAQKTQTELDRAALHLNREQARTQAAERSAIHANKFRNALASQVALASMRGGSGSLVKAFGNQAYRTFLQDEEAISTGVEISEIQGDIQQANITARSEAKELGALTRFSSNAFEGINTNILKGRSNG